jgi:hypothetical protein
MSVFWQGVLWGAGCCAVAIVVGGFALLGKLEDKSEDWRARWDHHGVCEGRRS